MTRESLKESVRRIVDQEDVRFVGENCCEWARRNRNMHKLDRRHKVNNNVYAVWYDESARVTFEVYEKYYKDDFCKSVEHLILWIVMRKKGGNYIIIGRNPNDRLIEIDRDGYEWHYDYEGLKKLIQEYPDVFYRLGVKE